MQKKFNRSVPATALRGGRREPSAEARMIRRLGRKLAAAQLEIARLRAIAETDFLLGIANRRGFETALARAVAYIKRYDARAALIVLDVDRLKPINDRFGHAAGDAVLKAIVDTVQRKIRASDVLGRLGGDEFALLLWNLGSADARAKAAGLEAAIDGLALVYDGHRIAVGISAGVVEIDASAEAETAMMRADQAMYQRKTARRQPPVASHEAVRADADEDYAS
ncbi:MAG: hypothetical protein BGP05_11235 [Rhizobiales bacterium 62-47]|jgi:diguanylate cyclase (GGDEF)-like protein|nr:GGDEF domain-containing protein [Hyphomicrobiales bacterium]OJY12371.1 MAG: hypothetical protein BGP05_11235 [Rhizobiales bacterium 62-47]